MVSGADLVHSASDAAFAVDRRLRVTAWNRRAEEVLGYSAEEALGQSCHTVLRAALPDGQPLCTPNCSAALCFARCLPYGARSCLCRRKDGTLVRASLGSMTIPTAFPGDETLAIVFLRPLDEAVPSQSLDNTLRIFTLGYFSLAAGDRGIPIERWERKQPLSLLKFLAAHRGIAVHRDRLAEVLWPGASERQGRDRLKVAVHFLRQQLEKAGTQPDLIGTAGEAYILQRDGTWIDSEAFGELVRQAEKAEQRGRRDEALRWYQEAEDLYRGDYLEEDLYAEWCAAERERLKERYLDALGRMAGLYAARGEDAQAAQVCRRALVREPCRESFHRALMASLWHQGRRDEALAQFRSCAQVLQRELGVEPMPETQRLYRSIMQSPRPAAAVASR